MSANFVNNLNIIFDATREAEGENVTTNACKESINHYTFYQLTLIPAVLISLSFCVTKPRRRLLLNLFNGRPGLIFPMNTLTRSSRFSYACSFGATAFLVYRIVLYQTYAIEYDGNRAVKSFIAIASMFIYGMVFFPLFVSLAIGSMLGYFVGALYVWMLTGVEIYRLSECQMTVETRLLVVLRGLPSLLCLGYLSVSIPVRMVQAWRSGKYIVWQDNTEARNTLDDIRKSYAGHHVTKLLRKPVIDLPPENTKARIKGILLSLVDRFIYQRTRGFRYPARIISAMFIGVLVVYTLTIELVTTLPPAVLLYRDALGYYTDVTIGVDPQPGEDPGINDIRQLLLLGWYILHVFRICMIVSIALAAVFALLNVLHSLSSYRANLFALYRGDHSHMPPASAYSNTSQCVNSIKYAGFQVGYIIWSYLIQFGILTLLCFVCATIVVLIMQDFGFWMIWIIEYVWPIVVTALVVALGQILLAKFVFLQQRGLYLALDNRSVYFNFAYFMFFYNIFLGLASCLLRILKAMFVGVVFLSRLDNSTLPRRFEFIDPGFKAYVGYMHMEAAHTHPVVVVFSRLMLLGLQTKKHREENKGRGRRPTLSKGDQNGVELKGGLGEKDVHIDVTGPSHSHDDVDDSTNLTEDQRRRSVAARFNWHVTYTLLHNPEIRVMRKGYIQQLRQARQLGVHIPISDRQADIDFTLLAGNIAEAKEKMNPSSKKKDKVKEEGGLEETVEGGIVGKGVQALALNLIQPVDGEAKMEKEEDVESSEGVRSDVSSLCTAVTGTSGEEGGEERVCAGEEGEGVEAEVGARVGPHVATIRV